MRHLDMVRLSVGLAAIVALSACTGLISSHPQGDGSATPEEQAAEQKWISEALPALTNNTCTSCHESGQDGAPTFLAANNDTERRDVLLNYNPQVVDVGDAAGSRILVKGAHEGPALTATASESILDWINAEHDAESESDPTPIIETAQFNVLMCTGSDSGGSDCPITRVSLDGIAGISLPGAEVDFIAHLVGDDLYVNELVVIASTTQGINLTHPLFTTFPPPVDGSDTTPLPDTLDRFFDVKLNLAPTVDTIDCPPIGSGCSYLDAGEATFHGFSPANPLTISFETLGAYEAGSDMGSGSAAVPTGCGSNGFASFLTNVEPLMDESGACVSCHNGQNTGATSAMPLTGLTSMTDNTACLAVRQHINFQDVSESGLLIAPESGSMDTNHPFKLTGQANTPSYTAFSTAVNTWITVEATGM